MNLKSITYVSVIAVGITSMFSKKDSTIAIIGLVLAIIGLLILLWDILRSKPNSNSKQITYGQFLDTMGDVAEDFPSANAFFQMLYITITGYQWEIRSATPVGTEHVKHFVDIMHRDFWELISEGDAVGALQSEAGAFLCAVRNKCVELGIDVGGINFNPPLSPRETPLTSGNKDLTLADISVVNDHPGD
ncbi:MAG: hypothetical protein WC711_02220 [Candidatus Staskawiczbacteria bacterium]